jgi:transposase
LGECSYEQKVTKFSPEVRERIVRLAREQRSEHPSMRAAVESIAPMIGCTSQTLHEWVERDGVTIEERERLKALERKVKELRRANEILKVASAFFAQTELDRRLKSSRPSLIVIATPSESSQSARSCELPLLATDAMPRSSAIRYGALFAQSAMNVCGRRSSAYARPTCRFTAHMGVWKQMSRQRIAVARCTAERSMKQLGLRDVVRGKRVRTTVPDAIAPRPLDRVNRQFKAARP